MSASSDCSRQQLEDVELQMSPFKPIPPNHIFSKSTEHLNMRPSDAFLDMAMHKRSVFTQQTPRPVMSLVGLKRWFFKQTSAPEVSRLLRRSHSNEYSTPNDSSSEDVESQDYTSFKMALHKAYRVNPRIISDATIGLSDGLTVPFALTAGLSALGNTQVVIYGGLAELIAGAISMGLGGWLGAKSEAASYKATRDEALRLIITNPQAVLADITEVLEPFQLPEATLNGLTTHLAQSPKLIDFVMQFQHCAERPAASRAVTSAMTIALGYFLGGLLPLVPYLCVGKNEIYTALYISMVVMVFALFAFGYVKTCVVIGWHGKHNVRDGCFGGLQMVVVGSFAAGAAMGLVRSFDRHVDVDAMW